jgi:hypothetical protein
MRNALRLLTIAVVVLGLSIPALAADPYGELGARDGSTIGGPAPVPFAPASDLLDEGFEDVALLPFTDDWCFQNNSSPLGVTSWFQGNSTVFPAQAGPADSYAGANYNNSGSPGNISNWLVTPVFDMSSVQTFSFWTRTVEASGWADRARVWVCLGDGTSCCDSLVGAGVEGTGDFTIALDDINPSEVLGGYPETWTEYTYTNDGSWTGNGRFAFQYYIHDSGPSGNNSNYIGVDTMQVSSGAGDGGSGDGGDDGGDVPATTTWGVIVLIALFLGVTLFYLRRRSSAGA